MDIDAVKRKLSYIAVGDHMGDVNNALPGLCDALDLPRPTWSDKYNHWVFEWDQRDEK